MQRLRKLVHLTSSDRHLLVSAALVLGAIRLGLWLLPFQTLRRLLARSISVSTELQASDQAFVGKVVWAVEGASRYMPGGVKCLARALATQVLLGRCGHPTQLYIGVAKDKQGNLEAHAWVESQGRIITGGLRDMTRFTPLPSLEEERA
jgi:hypothetical protein